jgi:hypothetical protein
MAELTRGILSLIFGVSQVEISISFGSTLDFWGISRTSSKVRLDENCSLFIVFLVGW